MLTLDRPWRAALVGLLALGTAALTVGALRAEEPKPQPKEPVPAEKPPEPPPVAEEAPEKAADFTLKDLEGKDVKLSQFQGKWVVLEWMNYDCPYVKKHYKITPGVDGKPDVLGKMAQLQQKFGEKGVVWLSICSSAPGNQGYMSVEKWKEAVKERKATPTAVLRDEDGAVGKLYGAKKTPTVWIVDPKGFVGYFGAVDDKQASTEDPLNATNYVEGFLDAVLAGKEPAVRETTPYG